MAVKTSIFIDKLSEEAKKVMHNFLSTLNNNEMKLEEVDSSKITEEDIENLSLIFSRLQLQQDVSKINETIEIINSKHNLKVKKAIAE